METLLATCKPSAMSISSFRTGRSSSVSPAWRIAQHFRHRTLGRQEKRIKWAVYLKDKLTLAGLNGIFKTLKGLGGERLSEGKESGKWIDCLPVEDF